MGTSTCPHCHANVVVGEDGVCPRCSAQIFRAQQSAEFPGWASVPRAHPARVPLPQLAETGNPYQAPTQSVSAPTFDFWFVRDLLEIAFSYQGRVPRRYYWAGWVTLWCVQIAYANTVRALLDDSVVRNVLFLIGAAAFLYVAFALMVKRWHDRNKSGWWVFIYFVPFIGPLWLFLETGFGAGTDGPNHYGPASI